MSYKPARKPWLHQKEALAKRRKNGKIAEAFAFLLGMRLGKTKILLDDFGELEDEGEVAQLAVIAPGGVYRTWEDAIRIDLAPGLLARTAVHVWESGSSKRQSLLRKEFMSEHGVRILLMNVEALSVIKEAREMLKRFLVSSPTLLAIDESTAIKSSKAKRTKFISDMGSYAAYRRILSGLPTPRSPLDIYSQFEFLDWTILNHRSYHSFAARYAIMVRRNFGGRSFNQIVGYQDVDHIQKMIEPHSYRKRLDEVYDVPPPSWSFRDVTMTVEQENLYRKMKEYATVALGEDEFVTATIVITQILRLHQILCGHVTDELGKVHPVTENRTRELISILEEYEGKAIIWCSYDYNVRKVSEALEDEFGEGCTAKFWGGNKKDREGEEKRFKTDPNCRFMIATAAAGGRGRTWTVANLIIYFSSGYDLEHRSQSEERASGVGKEIPIAYIDMRVPGTVEGPMINALRNKINLASAITGDNYREWLI